MEEFPSESAPAQMIEVAIRGMVTDGSIRYKGQAVSNAEVLYFKRAAAAQLSALGIAIDIPPQVPKNSNGESSDNYDLDGFPATIPRSTLVAALGEASVSELLASAERLPIITSTALQYSQAGYANSVYGVNARAGAKLATPQR